ncbi:MAG: VacJ family lipoprotein [Hyphomonadaceae bacterium]
MNASVVALCAGALFMGGAAFAAESGAPPEKAAPESPVDLTAAPADPTAAPAEAPADLSLSTEAAAEDDVAIAEIEPLEQAAADYDPWEGMNRDLFAFHESIDMAVLEPAARGYRSVAPTPVRSGISNFLRNLRGPQIFANDVLQGQPSRAGVTAGRFVINSTLGFLGFFDPASRMGLERHTEDFGQTLGVWGVPPGPYMFIPLFGPTNVRDTIGAVVNLALDPINYLEFDGDTEFMVFRTGMSALSARESVIEAIDNVRESSIDPYVTIRSTYGLLRESSIRNGLSDVQDLPEFDAIPSEPGISEAPAEPQASADAPGADMTGGSPPPDVPSPSDAELRGFGS